jgi:hypothetical protein
MDAVVVVVVEEEEPVTADTAPHKKSHTERR